MSNANIHTSIGAIPSSAQVANLRSSEVAETNKRSRAKGASKGKAKRLKQDIHNTTLRPIAPRVLALPMQSPFVIAASPATPQVNEKHHLLAPLKISNTEGEPSLNI